MSLQTQNRIIESFCDDTAHAMSLLFTHYTNLSGNDKEQFVLALIGKTVTDHQLLKQKMYQAK